VTRAWLSQANPSVLALTESLSSIAYKLLFVERHYMLGSHRQSIRAQGHPRPWQSGSVADGTGRRFGFPCCMTLEVAGGAVIYKTGKSMDYGLDGCGGSRLICLAPWSGDWASHKRAESREATAFVLLLQHQASAARGREPAPNHSGLLGPVRPPGFFGCRLKRG
jgi:hypothetical protein